MSEKKRMEKRMEKERMSLLRERTEKKRRRNEQTKKKRTKKFPKKKSKKKLTPSVDLRLLDGRLPQQLRCRRGRLARHEPRDRVRLEHAALGRLQGRDLAERVELQKLGRLVRLAHLEARDLDGDPGELRGDERLVGVLVARVGVELELGGGHGG